MAFQDSSSVIVGNINATGVSTVAAGTVSAPAITTTGDTNTGIFFPAADTIAFAEGGVEAMRIASSSFVGIGTNNPNYKLEVAGTLGVESTGNNVVAGLATLFEESANRTRRNRLQIGGDASGAFLNATWSSGGTGVMRFQVEDTERMRITSAGNVGIGNTSPSTLLTVGPAGNINAVTSPTLRVQGLDIPYGSYGAILFNATDGFTSTSKRFLITNALDANKFAIIRSTDSSTDPAITTNGAISSGTADFVINNSGNVGLGTTSPAVRLDIQNAGVAAKFAAINGNSNQIGFSNAANADFQFFIGSPAADVFQFSTSGGTERMRITSNGNVGIGQTSVTDKLEVTGSIRINGGVFKAERGTASAPGYAFGDDLDTGMFNISNADLGFTVGGTERMRIDSSGRVGIGQTSPAFPLDINAAIGVMRINSSTGTNTAYLYTTNTGGDFYFGRDNSAGSAFGGSAYAAVLYSSGAYPMQFFTNATERMRIASDGNVGIGTGTAISGARLSVATPTSTVGQLVVENSSYATGQVIGLDFTVAGGARQAFTRAVVENGNTAATALTFGTATGGNNAAERMRIDSSGNLLVGTTGASAKLTVQEAANQPAGDFYTAGGASGTPCMYVKKQPNDGSTSQVYVQFLFNNASSGNGQINGNGSGAAAFGSYSDIRLKENVTNLDSQLDNICALRPVEFDYKTGGHQIGFIAQEMQEVYPDAVGTSADGMLTITGWSKTEARLVKAIQEQQALITSLTARIAALESN
jgi:hypothetical protein